MMDDNKLADASYEFDNFLIQFSAKYELPALLVTSIALARLVHLNKQFGDKKDFIELLNAITGSPVFGDEEKVTH
jgi:hypothetical protein